MGAFFKRKEAMAAMLLTSIASLVIMWLLSSSAFFDHT